MTSDWIRFNFEIKNLPSDQKYLFHHDEDSYLFFYRRLNLIFLFSVLIRSVFLVLKAWNFCKIFLGSLAKFYSRSDYHLAIINSCAYRSAYCLLI